MRNKLTFTVCCLAVSMVAGSFSVAQKPIAIKGGKVITMTGETIENGTVIVRDGRIAAVGKDLKVPVEAQIIDATDQVVMPGFVEAHTSSGMSQANETNQTVPYLSVIDSIDPMNSYFRDARRNGITSVAITPGNSTLIGGQAAVIKTGGDFVDEMILKPVAGIKISLRPVSGGRMSHLAKLRKALDAAKKKLADKAEAKKDKDKKESADKKKDTDKEKKTSTATQPETKVESELDKAMFALLEGKIPAIIYCEKAMDVGQAIRLIKEYKLDAKMVLGRDCHKAAAQVAQMDLPVVLDSTMVYWEEDPRTKEEKKIVLPEIFREHGVKFVFQVARSNSQTLGSNFLWYQAATAVKYGMSEQDALEALTILPAKLHGVEKFVGTIEKGKDADLVILSGEPLKVGTWVDKTIVSGEVVYEKDKDEQLKRLLTGEETDSE